MRAATRVAALLLLAAASALLAAWSDVPPTALPQRVAREWWDPALYPPGVGEASRSLMHAEFSPPPMTIVFEECVGQPVKACQALITGHVTTHPEAFVREGDGEFSLAAAAAGNLTIEVVRVRTPDDPDYHLVGLRTNLNETGVAGVLGDGLVFYPWTWCRSAQNRTDGACDVVGPWDCDIGSPLPVKECCDLIRAAVPYADDRGNGLECYEDHPAGSVTNPADYSRVTIKVDKHGVVVFPPRNE